MEGNAYWVKDGKCLYSFKNAKFSGIEGKTADSTGSLNIGFMLKYKSEEDCESDKFMFELSSYCELDTKKSNYQKFSMG